MNEKPQNKRKSFTKQVSRAALAMTEGLFSHSVDMTLWLMIYLAELSIPFHTYGKAWRAAAAADRFLNQVNYDVIKNAIVTAKKRGYLKTSRRHAWPEITEAGRRRLAHVIPVYDERRAWDGRMHLVTYDIPEKRSDDRFLFREYLRRIGCGRLQDSVWMTPFNPIDLVGTFIEERDLQGTVIVSDLGQDGSLGDEDIRGIIVRVYDLERINEKYEEWLAEVQQMELDRFSIIKYLAILKEDPQLPFVLLPPWWKGGVAHKIAKSSMEN